MSKMVVMGSDVPNGKYNDNLKISFSKEVISIYIPKLNEVAKDEPDGLRLLLIAMTSKEGFTSRTRSFRTNNPGNLGNTDSGKNNSFSSLEAGIEAQVKFIKRVASGTHPMYLLDKLMSIPAYYSKEIAENPKTYAGMDPNVPGYRFIYKGELRQFVKRYSTGARQGNGYVNWIMSFFENHGIELTPESRIQDIIKIEKP